MDGRDTLTVEADSKNPAFLYTFFLCLPHLDLGNSGIYFKALEAGGV